MPFARRGLAALPFALAALLALLLAAGCDGSPDPPPLDEPLPRNALYVPNQGSATVSVISTETNAVVQTLDLTEYGFSANAKPHHAVVEPDGSAFYVSLIGADLVAKFGRRGALLGTAPFVSPGMIALHPTRDLLYATHTMSLPNVPSTAAVIRRSDMTPVPGGDPVEVSISRPHGVGVHPGGGYAYTGSLTENRLAIIDAETQAVRVEGQDGPVQRYVHLALAPDGTRLYATGQEAGQVSVFDASDPAAPSLTATVDAGTEPFHPTISDDGTVLYFGNKGDDTVAALDTETLTTETVAGEGLAQPHGTALSPNGAFLYVSNQNLNGTYAPAGENGTVVVIGTASFEIVDVIEVGRRPAGIGTR